MVRVELAPVDRVEITVLMDNVTDPLLVDQEAVARVNWPKALLGRLPMAASRVSPDTGVPDALIAEPGFSALVRIEKDGRKRTLLFDTGVSPYGMVENMRRLGIDAAEVEVIVLSHGHWDHVTGMEGLRELGRLLLRLTGNDAVAAIIGGFHLSGPMFERIIEPTVDALVELGPSTVMPAHCTGWKAVHRLATALPGAFVMSTVGTAIAL